MSEGIRGWMRHDDTRGGQAGCRDSISPSFSRGVDALGRDWIDWIPQSEKPAPKILSRRIDVPIRPVRLDLCLASGCALGDLGLLCRPHNPP